jgi:hypothetical protein
MEKNKAAGTDSIPIEFYQSYWQIIKTDIIQLFSDFHQDKVDISRINYGIVTLLPKISDASRIQQYRPICLLNCLYKLITKTLTLRIEPFVDKLIHPAQSAFMKGRNIMSRVLTLHEILHETKQRKEYGVVLKLNFKKAYEMGMSIVRKKSKILFAPEATHLGKCDCRFSRSHGVALLLPMERAHVLCMLRQRYGLSD